jgi:hypothetical protein
MYNLTDNQKALAKWLVQEVRAGKLDESFEILWINSMAHPTPQAQILNCKSSEETYEVTMGGLDALAANKLIICESSYKTWQSGTPYEHRRRCTLTGKIYEAVDSDFDSPDISFIQYLTPLENINSFDQELKERCFRMLSAGGSDPMLWDSAVRTAGVILEERLRDVGSIVDPQQTGRGLVNKVFGKDGTLSSKFPIDAEREGYRDLYAGIVGTYRNPSAHRLIDPSPEEGGAFIVFINLLLKKLELLR